MRRLAHFFVYAAIASLVVGLSTYHADYIGHYNPTGTARLSWELTYVAILSIAAYAVGLPDLPSNSYNAVGLAVVANLSAALTISVIELAEGAPLLPRFVVFWAASLLVPVYVLCALVAARGRREERRRDRVLAVLTPDEALALESDTRRSERKFSLARVMSQEEAGMGETGRKPLLEAFAEVDASILVLDLLAQSDESVVAQAAELHGRGVRIRTLWLFYDEWFAKLPLSELERVALMFDIGELHRLQYGRVKRLVDGVAAVFGLVVLVLLAPIVVLGNVFGNRGPLFFRQARVGKGGQVFTMLKFRTMTPGSGDGEWTADNDLRITPFGRWLRKTHLDELPQVINILRGEVAIVGPRPEQPGYVRQLAEKIPFYELRHLTRPGLTGWAQLNYPYGDCEVDAMEKLQYEFYYLRHQSVLLDLRVILRTLREVVRRGGR